MSGVEGLQSARRGSRWRLLDGAGSGTERLRLAQNGLRAGAELTLMTRTGGGGGVVAVGPYRLALDAVGLGRLRVEPLA